VSFRLSACTKMTQTKTEIKVFKNYTDKIKNTKINNKMLKLSN